MTGAVVTLGETMGLLRATGIGSLEHMSDFALHIGGAESNVAIGAARLGRSAVWIGRVGDDALGRRVLRELRAEGVAVDAVVDPEASTGLMLKESPTQGTTRVSYYRSASAGSRLNVGDLDLDAIASAGVLHVTGITLALSDSAEQAVFAAVDAAVEAGVPVSFDVNHRTALWGDRDPRAAYRRVAELATIVFAGPEEAALLVGPGSPAELARRIADLGPAQVIVKLGEDGCVASIDGEALATHAEQITPLDTVGAGDAFVAGYLVALLDGLAPADRLRQGARCGAFACLGPGDWESLPRRSDLDAFGSGDPVIR
ncbi:sugar kinase [Pseudolysinimonas yzui]|uniref:Ribokinase n=1 Tax=Pseudolysinimonas yzui TaxID=2708254 RepID=A0A8J3GRV6_9MICO|nr:sugar kinase [Pseudolysinimonas yzui]GHF22814.1 ribokinase [Pseudolysinimonas yzui]